MRREGNQGDTSRPATPGEHPITLPYDELATLLDCRHTAILVVDVQKRFTQRRRAPMFPALNLVLPRLQWFIKQAHDAGVLVGRIQAIKFDDTNGGLSFHPGFEPQPGDLLVMKRHYSAFFGTTLETILRDRHIATVVLAGLKTNVCVGSTARDAFQLGFNVVTLGDCTAANSQIGHEGELHTLTEYFGMVCSSSDVAHRWSNGSVADERKSLLLRDEIPNDGTNFPSAATHYRSTP